MKPAPRTWQYRSEASRDPRLPLLQRVLAARPYLEQTAKGTDAAETGDPLLLPDMDKAVSLIRDALARNDLIAIYGDYDTDGVTASALLVRAFRSVNARILPYIPDRQTEGYGLNAPALEDLASQGTGLVITVDCGTTSTEIVTHRPKGMRMIITDHHLPPSDRNGAPRALPPADALINPKLPHSSYPFDGLAGVGVAWKLVEACERAGVLPEGSAGREVGLAALGTIADIMPLTGENRFIVQRGLSRLSEGGNLGMYALAAVSRIDLPLRAQDVAFGLGPRINAAGRLETAHAALELCLTDDPEAASRLARELDSVNTVRKERLAAALSEAEMMVEALPEESPVIVVGSPDWHMGIVGLVAGRLMERYARPSFAVALDPLEAKGSGRSLPGIPILDLLKGSDAHLTKYGGHAAAAGFSLEAASYPAFRDALLTHASSQGLPADPARTFSLDGILLGQEVTLDSVSCLDSLEPFGYGNPQPQLALLDCTVRGTRTFGRDRTHLGITVETSDKATVEVIAFNKADVQHHLPAGRPVDCCVTLERHTWNGMETPQLLLKDIQPHRTSA